MSEPAPPPLPPPPPPPTASDERPGLPWERRAELGAVQSFVATLKRLTLAPSDGFREAKRRGELVSPLSYAVLVGWIGVLAERIWSLLVGSSLAEILPPEMAESLQLGLALSGFGLAIALILTPVIILVVLFVYGAIVHLFLLLFGATRASDTGFEGTLRALCWSWTSQLGQLVPFAGGLIAVVWCIVLQTLSLAEMHRTTQGRALAAVLTPVVLCCVCAVFFFASIAAVIAGSIAAGGN